MPIPSGCCSRLAFRCVRFPAASLGLRFFRRAGFPVPSVRQSVVRSGFPLRPFSGSGPRLAVLSPRRVSRSVRTVVRSGSPLCIRFPAAALGLRFSAVPDFPFRPSGSQSFVRALRCASVSRQRPSACGFPPCRVSRSVRTVVRSGFPLCVRFPAASLGLRFFRRAGFPVPWGSRTYRTLCRPLSLPLLSLLPLSAFFSLCRFSLSAAPLCLLLSLQPHSLLPPRLYRCGRRLAGII